MINLWIVSVFLITVFHKQKDQWITDKNKFHVYRSLYYYLWYIPHFHSHLYCIVLICQTGLYNYTKCFDGKMTCLVCYFRIIATLYCYFNVLVFDILHCCPIYTKLKFRKCVFIWKDSKYFPLDITQLGNSQNVIFLKRNFKHAIS